MAKIQQDDQLLHPRNPPKFYKIIRHSASVEYGAMQKCADLVDFDKRCKMMACMYLPKNRLRYSQVRAPTSLLYDQASRALIWNHFRPKYRCRLPPARLAGQRPCSAATGKPGEYCAGLSRVQPASYLATALAVRSVLRRPLLAA